MSQPKTLFQKVWDDHVVLQEPESPAVLYIDLHMVHEVTSPQAFAGLRGRGLKVRRPDRTVAVVDHGVPSKPAPDGTSRGRLAFADDLVRSQIAQLESNCAEFCIALHGLDSPDQGIVHIVGPELGLTRPGMTIVCGDSHTATHGAFGALAFGIGTSEVEHVLATQCILQYKPQTCLVQIEGSLQPGVSAKDVILALIAQVGVSGGQGYVFEYAGPVIRSLDMEERMTICNMSIEAGARAGMIAPDDTTFTYLAQTPFGKDEAAWEASLPAWRKLSSDPGAVYDKTVTLDVSKLAPMFTYGITPGMGIPVNENIPSPESFSDPAQRAAVEKALAYMDLAPGEQLIGHPVDVVFIGSCTNGRISDLRQAARLMKGAKVAPGVRVLVVPGSYAVKSQAQAEGLDKIFEEAGAEWRDPSCSMCIAMNGDQLEPGQYAVSTSNRNFEGRQGKGGRTFLASPLSAAAATITGKITDVRTML